MFGLVHVNGNLTLVTGLDGARPAKKADPIGQAPVTLEFLDGNALEIRDFFLIHGQEPLQEVFVVVPGGIVNAAYAAVKSQCAKNFFSISMRPPSDIWFFSQPVGENDDHMTFKQLAFYRVLSQPFPLIYYDKY